jgi:GH18 family chitinase
MFKSIKTAIGLLAQFDNETPFEPVTDEMAPVDGPVEETTDTENTTEEQAKEVGEKCGVNWEEVAFEPVDLAKGIDVEYEHGSVNEQTNITNDDIEMTAKIAIAHLNEGANYYELLAELESNLSDGEEEPEEEVEEVIEEATESLVEEEIEEEAAASSR